MSSGGQTRAIGKITSIPETFMKTPKLDSEQKVVNKVVFLSPDRVHGRTEWRHDRAPSKAPQTPKIAERCARNVLPSGTAVSECQGSKIADFLRFCRREPLRNPVFDPYSTKLDPHPHPMITLLLKY